MPVIVLVASTTELAYWDKFAYNEWVGDSARRYDDFANALHGVSPVFGSSGASRPERVNGTAYATYGPRNYETMNQSRDPSKDHR